jgi:RNA recognition motif-containing protein
MAAQRKQEEDEATVFVRNLPLDLLGPELEEVFSEVGPVKSAAVIHNKRVPGGGPQLSRGFGFVTFALAADVSDAIRKFHGRRIRGRAMSVEPCGEKNKPASPGAAAGASPAAKSFPPKVEKVIAKDDSTEKAAPSTNAPSGETKTASAASKKQSQPTSENNGEDEEASDEVTPASKVKSKKANKLASVAEAEENASVPVQIKDDLTEIG